MDKIGLVAAMPEETEHILDKLGKIVDKRNVLGYQVLEYAIYDKSIFLINSGVGEINSATATTILLLEFGVESVINFGIAGALKDIEIGELLVAKDIVHYDFDVSGLMGIPKGKYLDEDKIELECDQSFIRLADKANGSELRRVRIASADKFVATSSIKRELIKDFGADICEMESAGIIRVCRKAGIPSLFIKTVSDNADESAEEQMDSTVQRGITAYAQLIESLIKII